MKNCKLCGNEKPLEEFSKHSGFKDGRNSRCKDCRNKSEKVERDCGKRKTTAYSYRHQLVTRYNLSIPAYENMLLSQGAMCAICGEADKKLNVDHCHITGVVRGLLCTKCNTGLGKFNDSTSMLSKAISYLQNYGSSIRLATEPVLKTV